MTTDYRFPDAISYGSHTSPNKGACVMETAALFAGEPFSDHPACACPVITEFAIRVNDQMPDDATRTRLLGPLVPLIAGSRRDAATEQRRGFVAADWAIRVFAPLALEAVGLDSTAAALRAVPVLRGRKSARAGRTAADAAAAVATVAAAAVATVAADAAVADAVAAADAAAYAAAYAAAVAAAAAAAYAAARAADAAAVADAVAADAWEQAAACIRAMCVIE